MRLNTLAAAAIIAVVALGATGCKSSSKASGTPAASNPSATETQADSASAQTTASSSATEATSVAAAASTGSPSASSSASASSAPAAAGGAINTCSLLSGAQAATLSGRAFGAGTESTLSPGADQCEYPYADGVAMDVIIYEPNSGVNWAALQAQLSGEGTVMPVTGVGDKAMFAAIDLDVATGKYLIDISAAGGDGDDTGAIAIAKQLVGELASK
jgi:hypothetical protein